MINISSLRHATILSMAPLFCRLSAQCIQKPVSGFGTFLWHLRGSKYGCFPKASSSSPPLRSHAVPTAKIVDQRRHMAEVRTQLEGRKHCLECLGMLCVVTTGERATRASGWGQAWGSTPQTSRAGTLRQWPQALDYSQGVLGQNQLVSFTPLPPRLFDGSTPCPWM